MFIWIKGDGSATVVFKISAHEERRKHFQTGEGSLIMNQILKPARPEQMGFGGDQIRETEIDPRVLRSDVVEYDDGDPATILPAARRSIGGTRETGVGRRETIRTSLGCIDRTMAVDYDDGNPATVAADL